MTSDHAHIDDHLVRQHVLTLRLRRVLSSHTVESLSLREYLNLLGEVRALPADVQPALRNLRRILPADQADLAAMLLHDLCATTSLEAPPEQASAKVIPIGPDAGEDLEAPLADPAPPVSLLMDLAESKGGSSEELGLLWLQRFLPCAAEERLPILDCLLEHSANRCASVLRLEWHWGDLAGDPRLAELGSWHYPRFPMPWVEFPRGERGPTPAGGALEAWGVSVDETGHMVLIVSRREPDDSRTFAVLLLDLWHHGVEDVWGNSHAPPSSLASVKENFIALEPDVIWRPLRPRHAAGLVQCAHRRSAAACHLMPPEFWVWSDLYAQRADPPESLRRLWRPGSE